MILTINRDLLSYRAIKLASQRKRIILCEVGTESIRHL
jgi:hypothetical protein